MMQIGALHINTDRAGVLSDFYQKVLQCEPTRGTDVISDFEVGGFHLLIFNHDKISGSNSEPDRIFFDLMVDDVQAEFDRAVGVGATVIQEPYEFATEDETFTIATLADPDGNYFQFMSLG